MSCALATEEGWHKFLVRGFCRNGTNRRSSNRLAGLDVATSSMLPNSRIPQSIVNEGSSGGRLTHPSEAEDMFGAQLNPIGTKPRSVHRSFRRVSKSEILVSHPYYKPMTWKCGRCRLRVIAQNNLYFCFMRSLFVARSLKCNE